MEEVLDHTLAVVAERIAEKRLTVSRKITPDLPPIRADRTAWCKSS